jgi:hypothetical protein
MKVITRDLRNVTNSRSEEETKKNESDLHTALLAVPEIKRRSVLFFKVASVFHKYIRV